MEDRELIEKCINYFKNVRDRILMLFKKNMDNIKFSVVIPTQWNLKNISNFEHFLNILVLLVTYDNS